MSKLPKCHKVHISDLLSLSLPNPIHRSSPNVHKSYNWMCIIIEIHTLSYLIQATVGMNHKSNKFHGLAQKFSYNVI